MNHKWVISPLLTIALLLALSLAACGPQTTGSTSTPSATNAATSASTTTATQAASTATTPTTNTAAAATQTANSITSTVTSATGVQKCGIISTLPVQLQGSAPPQQVGNCFWQAYQQCSPAMMIVNSNGVDLIVSHVFLIEKQNGACVIVDTLSKGLAPKPPTVTSYVCTTMTNSNGALHLTGCGTEGEVTIPLK